MSTSSHASVELLRDRIQAVSASLEATLARPVGVDLSIKQLGETYVTGAGISAGPARYTAGLLRHAGGQNAQFVPPTFFINGKAPRCPRTLIVFSQGLSPNARAVLRSAHGAERVILVTAVEPSAQTAHGAFLREGLAKGWEVCGHGPPSEQGMLVRVLGPTLSMLQGARLVAQLATSTITPDDLITIPAVVHAVYDGAESLLSGVDLDHLERWPVHFVIAGQGQEASRGLAWKWMEGLWRPQPSVWDVMQIVHGPIQSFWRSEVTLIALEPVDPRSQALIDRLEQILHPRRHRLVRLKAQLSPSLATFEHAMQLDLLMLALIERSPRDLAQWPGKGVDAAIYDLERPSDIE